MALDDSAIIMALAIVAGIAITACIALIFIMRRGTEKPVKSPKKTVTDPLIIPSAASSQFRVTKSVQSNDAIRAKDELQNLGFRTRNSWRGN